MLSQGRKLCVDSHTLLNTISLLILLAFSSTAALQVGEEVRRKECGRNGDATTTDSPQEVELGRRHFSIFGVLSHRRSGELLYLFPSQTSSATHGLSFLWEGNESNAANLLPVGPERKEEEEKKR